jgi:hypothetical protein
MPVKIQSPDVARRVAEFFGIRGKYTPAVEEFIIPTIQVGDLSISGVPPVSRHASVAFTVAGVAAEGFNFRLLAPGGVLCVITDIILLPANIASFSASFTLQAAAGALVPAFTDSRLTLGQLFPENVPAAVCEANTVGAPLVNISWRSRTTPNVAIHFQPKGWVIGTGKEDVDAALMLQCETDDLHVYGSVGWDEYPIG